MSNKILIHHKRNVKWQGIRTLVILAVISIGIICFMHAFFQDLREHVPLLFFGFYGVALVVSVFIVVIDVIPNLLSDGDFHCTLYEDRIECRSPARGLGKSFAVPLTEIVAIERRAGNEGTDFWYCITPDDQRLWITSNYGNPVYNIISELKRLRPEIPVIEK